MAFDDFLNHRCSIYHVKKAASDLGFGITDDNDFSYQANPDKINEDVRCHFHIKSGMYQITQQEPLNEYGARVKISFPFGTDIRKNDKIVSRETGYAYIAELPRKVQNHHVIVYANRQGSVREAI